MAHLESSGGEAEGVELLDLRDVALPMCDGSAAFAHGSPSAAAGAIAGADLILLASPVYNYDLNAAAKNLLELTGRAWTEKVVGFLLAAGGRGSYMSAMGFATSLMLDFRCLVLPRFVYAVKSDFDEEAITNPEVAARVEALCAEGTRIARALAAAPRND